jgi:signal transduction histidine kinase
MPPNVSPALMQIARASFAARVVLTALLCTLLAVVAARRLARPLSQLAVAVEQLGGNGEAPAIPLNGPREVRRAIIAFNRMRDRLRRFNEDRTRMIAAMSHDLRTPLTRLRMRAELVADTDQQNRMLFELDKMNGLIDSILSFAKDDSRNEPRSLVDLSALVDGICEDAADAGEPVTFSGPREVTISCRPAALRRAVSNLVDNAVKYGRTAAVTLMPGPERVVLTIEDEGPGIPRHEHERWTRGGGSSRSIFSAWRG